MPRILYDCTRTSNLGRLGKCIDDCFCLGKSHIPLLSREYATLKQDPDACALGVTKARAHLLAEARCLAPGGMSPFEHACSVCTTANLESGLLPPSRLELIRGDPVASYREFRARAEKHEANNLRRVNPTAPTSNPSPAVQPLSLSKQQHEQKLAGLET